MADIAGIVNKNLSGAERFFQIIMMHFAPALVHQRQFDRLKRKVDQAYDNARASKNPRRIRYWHEVGYEWSRQAANVIIKYGHDDRTPDPRCGYPPEFRYPKMQPTPRKRKWI